MSEHIKRCACGKLYTLEEWLKLPLVGDHDDGVECLEMRNCECNSTIALVVEYKTEDGRYYLQEETQ